MLCLQINYGLSLKEHLPRTQERLEGDYLEHHCERSLNLCDWSIVKFVFIDRRNWNSDYPGMWYTLAIELIS